MSAMDNHNDDFPADLLDVSVEPMTKYPDVPDETNGDVAIYGQAEDEPGEDVYTTEMMIDGTPVEMPQQHAASVLFDNPAANNISNTGAQREAQMAHSDPQQILWASNSSISNTAAQHETPFTHASSSVSSTGGKVKHTRKTRLYEQPPQPYDKAKETKRRKSIYLHEYRENIKRERKELHEKCSRQDQELLTAKQELLAAKQELLAAKQELLATQQELLSAKQEISRKDQELLDERLEIFQKYQELVAVKQENYQKEQEKQEISRKNEELKGQNQWLRGMLQQYQQQFKVANQEYNG